MQDESPTEEEPKNERLTETPSGVVLGPLDIIPDGGARNFVLEMKAGRFHGFVVRHGEHVHGYVDQCPHLGLPLARTLDDYLTPNGKKIACSWHGALFRVRDGACVAGPCMGAHLKPWPVTVRDGRIVTN